MSKSKKGLPPRVLKSKNDILEQEKRVYILALNQTNHFVCPTKRSLRNKIHSIALRAMAQRGISTHTSYPDEKMPLIIQSRKHVQLFPHNDEITIDGSFVIAKFNDSIFKFDMEPNDHDEKYIKTVFKWSIAFYRDERDLIESMTFHGISGDIVSFIDDRIEHIVPPRPDEWVIENYKLVYTGKPEEETEQEEE